ncbi:MAG TPA: RraA family protein [Bryobacteraceae bacterium]|nr:RraA family protein [Bryobacteraceae bacterium]
MRIPELSASDLKLLAQYDTPTICNVIELFDVRPRGAGYMDGRIRACFPEMPPIVGYASTATFRGAFPRPESTVYSSLDDQVKSFAELPGPPIVVFQDLDDPPMAATFGEVMCSTYQAFGAAGLITSGAARDLDQVRRLGFPAFSSGVICSHGYSSIVSAGQPVRVGGVAIFPRTLLHADSNGVTTVPHEIASEAACVAADFVAAEAIILDYLKTGERDPVRYSEVRKEAMARIADLGRRVRARSARMP